MLLAVCLHAGTVTGCVTVVFTDEVVGFMAFQPSLVLQWTLGLVRLIQRLLGISELVHAKLSYTYP